MSIDYEEYYDKDSRPSSRSREDSPKQAKKSKSEALKKKIAGRMQYKEKKRDERLSRGVVLGMYDRDFTKPFNKHHAKAVNEYYKKKTGKDLSNLTPEKL